MQNMALIHFPNFSIFFSLRGLERDDLGTSSIDGERLTALLATEAWVFLNLVDGVETIFIKPVTGDSLNHEHEIGGIGHPLSPFLHGIPQLTPHEAWDIEPVTSRSKPSKHIPHIAIKI